MAHPEVMLPLVDGKLDSAGALGIGVLSVIKDIGLKRTLCWRYHFSNK